jgi:sortase A
MKASRLPVPRKGHGSAILGMIEIALLAVGFSFMGVFAYVQLKSAIFDEVQGRQLDEAIAREQAQPGNPDTVSTGRGALLGRIEIPRAGISALVVEGAWDKELEVAVGRVVGTARFGEKGTVALAGHRDRHFRGLGKVQDGDTVTVTTPKATFAYVIDSTLVTKPEEVRLNTSATHGLMLITCYPFGYLGHAPKRFLVFGHQLDSEDTAVRSGAQSPALSGSDQRPNGSLTSRRPEPADSSVEGRVAGTSSLKVRQSS